MTCGLKALVKRNRLLVKAGPVNKVTMSSSRNAKVAFASAVAVLLISAVAAYITIVRLRESARWVVHTYQVDSTLGEIDSSLLALTRTRTGYSITGNESQAQDFQAAIPEVRRHLQELRTLTLDNPKQQEACTRLEDLVDHRINLLRDSVALKKSAPHDDAGQTAITAEGLSLSQANASILLEMRQEEQHLLSLRMQVSNRLFRLTVIILGATFALAVLLFFIHYRLLATELRARALAESAAREGEESLRTLTARLLQMQDEERRKFSRELHDSLGQYLAGVKMNLDMFARAKPNDELLANAIQLLDQSIAETRTISHLLHPPLLDEVGFSSAAKWYVQGFSERSGVDVRVDMPDGLGRLPRPLELGLFRVLQESLTNIHRHSKSSKAEVTLKTFPHHLVLQVKDYGKGIPVELLKAFQTKGTSFGVGLSGMRERVRELNGKLDVQSSSSGTLLSVMLPLNAEERRASEPSSELASTQNPVF